MILHRRLKEVVLGGFFCLFVCLFVCLLLRTVRDLQSDGQGHVSWSPLV